MVDAVSNHPDIEDAEFVDEHGPAFIAPATADIEEGGDDDK
jgi:hypothetical protein